MQVPRVSFSNEARGRGFDRMLGTRRAEAAVSRRDSGSRIDAGRSTSDTEASPPTAEATPATRQQKPRPAEPKPDPAPTVAGDQAAGDEAARQVVLAEREPAAKAESTRNTKEEGETARRNATGEGAASPASLAIEERLRNQVQRQTVKGVLGLVANAAPTGASPNAPRATGTPMVDKGHHASRTEKPAAAAAGYRTFSKQTLELAEQARDSVFKQIALRLTPERGEVRMLLDPPDLGQLDLRMSLDQSGRMSLSMLTERPELAVMLDKHMPELVRALAQSGLTMTQASVQQQSRDPKDQAQRNFHGADDFATNAVASAGDSNPRIEELARRSFFTSEGFDFWV